MDNIINMIKRIESEAETVEDMATLLISEIKAYNKFKQDHLGNITLYPDTKIVGNYAIVGDYYGCYIALQQKMKNDNLQSKYIEYKKNK